MAGFDYHCHDLTNLVLFMGLEVPQEERVEREEKQLVSADEARY